MTKIMICLVALALIGCDHDQYVERYRAASQLPPQQCQTALYQCMTAGFTSECIDSTLSIYQSLNQELPMSNEPTIHLNVHATVSGFTNVVESDLDDVLRAVNASATDLCSDIVDQLHDGTGITVQVTHASTLTVNELPDLCSSTTYAICIEPVVDEGDANV